MAYTEPTLKAKGDDPTLAQIQVYADNVDALVADAVAFRNLAEHGSQTANGAKEQYNTIIHRGTWLVYATLPEADGKKDTARIFPYLKNSAVGEEVTLPDAEGGGVYHLEENVPWMVAGRTYQVDNVLYAFEMPEF